MKTEERINVPRVRLAVLGNPDVGKSALTVRYLTRRFIGEYRSNTDLLYRQTVTVTDQANANQQQQGLDLLLDVEIIDVSTGEDDNQEFVFPADQVAWSDACLVVYSITDARSLQYAARTLQWLRDTQGTTCAALIANKTDLEHLRKVTESEGCNLAAQHNLPFFEVSVADNTPSLYKAFDRVMLECRARPAKTRKFSVSKMLGNLIGASNLKQTAIIGPSNVKQGPLQSGTVVPCSKGELHKSRVLKRRQNFTAAASL